MTLRPLILVLAVSACTDTTVSPIDYAAPLCSDTYEKHHADQQIRFPISVEMDEEIPIVSFAVNWWNENIGHEVFTTEPTIHRCSTLTVSLEELPKKLFGRAVWDDCDASVGLLPNMGEIIGQKVAVHELGHVLNLRHSEEGLMSASAGELVLTDHMRCLVEAAVLEGEARHEPRRP